jgi:hypothetical protein
MVKRPKDFLTLGRFRSEGPTRSALERFGTGFCSQFVPRTSGREGQ